MTNLFRQHPHGLSWPTMFNPWDHKDDKICLNCRHWRYGYPEADGRSGGRCTRFGEGGWRYDYISLRDDTRLELHTRCDFGCNQFSRKQTKGRFEMDIEDEP